jgi:hypothetical protein
MEGTVSVHVSSLELFVTRAEDSLAETSDQVPVEVSIVYVTVLFYIKFEVR